MSEPVTAEQAPRDGWRHLLVMLAMVAVAFLAQPDPAAAQIQTYYYQGPAFSIPFCEMYLFSSPPCTSGSMTASFTVNGVTSGYSGGVSGTQVVQWNISTNSIMGGLNTSNYLRAFCIWVYAYPAFLT
jgi:hypothetical protein